MTQSVYEDDLVTVRQADFCAVPGYLVVTLKNNAESLADLDTEQAARLGGLLASATAAIEKVTGAERVYCLSFCEQLRTLHFHLLPRTAQLLKDYQSATDSAEQPINGALLFEWARDSYPAEVEMPAAYPSTVDVCQQLEALLR